MVCAGAHTVAGTMVMSGIEPVRRQLADRAPAPLPQLPRSTPRPAADGPMAAPPPVPGSHLPFDRAAMVRRSLKLRGHPRRRESSFGRRLRKGRHLAGEDGGVERASLGSTQPLDDDAGGTDLHPLLAEPEQIGGDGGLPAGTRVTRVPRVDEDDALTELHPGTDGPAAVRWAGAGRVSISAVQAGPTARSAGGPPSGGAGPRRWCRT